MLLSPEEEALGDGDPAVEAIPERARAVRWVAISDLRLVRVQDSLLPSQRAHRRLDLARPNER